MYGEGFRSVVAGKLKKEVFRLLGKNVAETYFHTDYYLRHTARRLYHLSRPEKALEFLSRCCCRMLFLETCFSFGEEERIDLVSEEQANPTQSFAGRGCRPTREWAAARLKEHFLHVYVPLTQPCHEEFPLDWTDPALHHNPLACDVFIVSRKELKNDRLVPSLPDRQVRQE